MLLDADDLSDDRMQEIARWTNLAETTFVLAPTHQDADYRVRIFTPFGGHPTLGTAHAWREHGGVAKRDVIVQECTAGLITVRADADRLAFQAPPTLRSGPLDEADLTQIRAALGVEIIDLQCGWAAVQLADAATVRNVEVDWATLGDRKLGLVALGPEGVEVRALFNGIEDPVTGSLNASLAQWFFRTGKLDDDYVATQGTGRVSVSRVTGGEVWGGGATVTCFAGTAR